MVQEDICMQTIIGHFYESRLKKLISSTCFNRTYREVILVFGNDDINDENVPWKSENRMYRRLHILKRIITLTYSMVNRFIQYVRKLGRRCNPFDMDALFCNTGSRSSWHDKLKKIVFESSAYFKPRHTRTKHKWSKTTYWIHDDVPR